jgi:hypothetical protein
MEDNKESGMIDSSAENIQDGAAPAPKKAAILIGPIIVQSFSTPIVGAIMLIAGLLIGYFGRPLVTAQLAPTPTATAIPAAAESDSQAESRALLMQSLIAKTDHFQGKEDAPVVMLEFSDFQ